MRVHVQYDFKDFKHENYEPYSGFYTPKGRRNQKARIEIATNRSELEQINSVSHEHGHMLCDLYNGEVMKKTDTLTRQEHMFCYLLGRAAEQLWRKMKAGDLKVGRNTLVLNLYEDDLEE